MPELHSRFGYSAVSTFEQCPKRYKLQYIDGLKTIPADDTSNALILGTALHMGIETDVETAVDWYLNSYPIITDAHVNEEIKLRYWIPKVKEYLPPGIHEAAVIDDNFIGTLDYLAPAVREVASSGNYSCDECQDELCSSAYSGYCPCGNTYEHIPDTYDLYDFKYSNNWLRYQHSRQLHLYKYYYEKTHPGKHIRKMYFIFIPKIQIRQKKTEELYQFRRRLRSELEKAEFRVEEVQYDPQMVIDHLELTQKIMQCQDFPENTSKLCSWCQYETYCMEGETFEMLPTTKRVEINPASHKKIWIYGAPFSGKTTLADGAPTPLNLNTDGNVKTVTMPRLPIKDTMDGRQKKLAWEVFKEAIDDLEAGSDFETIVVDLLEDTYESCRLYMYKKLGIEHESDDGFRAWDKVRTEFLSTMRRLVNLPYNIILISHEDMSKVVTKRTGDKVTAIKPNIHDKIANKVAGMVDIVIRAVKEDDSHVISTKTSNVIFGGGRLSHMKATDAPNSWDTIEAMYAAAYGEAKPKEDPEPETESPAPATEDEPVRRTRRTRQ